MPRLPEDGPAAPGSPAASSSAAWAQPTSSSSTHEFCQKFSEAVKSQVAASGGPAQYLRKAMDDKAKQQPFLDHLWTAYAERSDVFYHHDKQVPPVPEQELVTTPATCVHISALGWSVECSMRAYPSMVVFDELVDLYLFDGFKTNSEPLQVLQPAELIEGQLGLQAPWADQCGADGPLPPHSLGYTKGMARSTTALAIAHFAWVANWDIEKGCPILHASLCQVWVHHVPHDNKVDILFRRFEEFACKGGEHTFENSNSQC